MTAGDDGATTCASNGVDRCSQRTERAVAVSDRASIGATVGFRRTAVAFGRSTVSVGRSKVSVRRSEISVRRSEINVRRSTGEAVSVRVAAEKNTSPRLPAAMAST
jgi:hypothetical protein